MAAKTDKTAMVKAARKADALLRDMVAITLKSDLSRIQRTNLETCITVHMHQKETSGALEFLSCVYHLYFCCRLRQFCLPQSYRTRGSACACFRAAVPILSLAVVHLPMLALAV